MLESLDMWLMRDLRFCKEYFCGLKPHLQQLLFAKKTLYFQQKIHVTKNVLALGELLLHLIRAINHDTRDRGLLSNGDGKRPPFVLFPTNHFFLEKWVQCTMFLKEIENALLSCKFMSNTLFLQDPKKEWHLPKTHGLFSNTKVKAGGGSPFCSFLFE